MLCLADLCDYNEYRAQNIVFELLEDELEDDEKKHWRANNAVSIEISVKYKAIFVKQDTSVDNSVIMEGFNKWAPIHIKNCGLDLEIIAVDKEFPT